jgi:hypothetical protein
VLNSLYNRSSFQDVKYRIASELSNADIVMNKALWLDFYFGIEAVQLDILDEKIE